MLVAELPEFLELKQLCSKLQLAMFVHKRLCCEEEACCEAHSVGLHIAGKAKKDLSGPACSSVTLDPSCNSFVLTCFVQHTLVSLCEIFMSVS